MSLSLPKKESRDKKASIDFPRATSNRRGKQEFRFAKSICAGRYRFLQPQAPLTCRDSLMDQISTLHRVRLIQGQTVNQYNPVTNAFDRAAPLVAYPDNVHDIFRNGYNWQSTVDSVAEMSETLFAFPYGYSLRNQGVLENNLLNRHAAFSNNTSSRINSRMTVNACQAPIQITFQKNTTG